MRAPLRTLGRIFPVHLFGSCVSDTIGGGDSAGRTVGDQQHLIIAADRQNIQATTATQSPARAMRHAWEITKSLNRLAEAAEKLVEARGKAGAAARLVASPNPLVRAYGVVELTIAIGEVTAASATMATETAFLLHNVDELDESSLKTQQLVRDVIDMIESPVSAIVDLVDEALGLELKTNKDVAVAVEGLKTARNALREVASDPKNLLEWMKRLNLVRAVVAEMARVYEAVGKAVADADSKTAPKVRNEREPGVREPSHRYINPDGSPRKPGRGPYPEPY